MVPRAGAWGWSVAREPTAIARGAALRAAEPTHLLLQHADALAQELHLVVQPLERLGLLDHLRAIGYGGGVSVELINPTLCQSKPVEGVEIAITALRRLLGLAQPAGS